MTAASATRTMVSTAITWLTRPSTGSVSPANQSKRPVSAFEVVVGGHDRDDAMTVTAVLAALERGAARAARDQAQPDQQRHWQPGRRPLAACARRRGGRAASASAARCSSGRPATRARRWPSASRRAPRPQHERDRAERRALAAPGRPTRPAPALDRSGAASQPISSPAAAATRARSRCSASRTAATRAGVPPAALSRPTRRVCSAIRPPASTATLATASAMASQLPRRQDLLGDGTRSLSASLDLLPGHAAAERTGTAVQTGDRAVARRRTTAPLAGSAELEVQHIETTVPRAWRGRGRRRAVSQTRPMPDSAACASALHVM